MRTFPSRHHIARKPRVIDDDDDGSHESGIQMTDESRICCQGSVPINRSSHGFSITVRFHTGLHSNLSDVMNPGLRNAITSTTRHRETARRNLVRKSRV